MIFDKVATCENGSIVRVSTDEIPHSKLFLLIDDSAEAIVVKKVLVPSLKNHTEPMHPLYITPEYFDDVDMSESGLIYAPKYFYEITGLPESYISGFKIDLELLNSMDQFLIDKEENKVDNDVVEIANTDTPVVETNTSEKYRPSVDNSKSKTDAIMEMVHERGQNVYELGRLESEINQLTIEFEEKTKALHAERKTRLEKIDTYDNCIRLYLKSGGME